MATSITASEAVTLVFPRLGGLLVKWKEKIEAESHLAAENAATAALNDQYASIFTDEQP